MLMRIDRSSSQAFGLLDDPTRSCRQAGGHVRSTRRAWRAAAADNRSGPVACDEFSVSNVHDYHPRDRYLDPRRRIYLVGAPTSPGEQWDSSSRLNGAREYFTDTILGKIAQCVRSTPQACAARPGSDRERPRSAGGRAGRASSSHAARSGPRPALTKARPSAHWGRVRRAAHAR